MAKKYFDLAQNLRRFLFERNLRPSDLSKELNIPAPTIHRMVTGKSTRPAWSSLEAIAKYFDINIEQLVGDNMNMDNSTDIVNSQVLSIMDWKDLSKNKLEIGNKKNIAVQNISKHGFAVIMNDSSMSPIFPKNSILIFDPEAEPIDRGYVLVKLHEANIYIFRQLLIDADRKFIKALNIEISNNSIKPLGPKDEIIAKLIEVRYRI